MIFKFLRKLSGGGEPETAKADPVEHNGYSILPAPRREAAGWRVMGSITREIDGEVHRYEFIRADVCSAVEDAVTTTVAKARRIVEEKGDRMFEDRPAG